MESACVVGGGAELPGVLTCVFIFGKRPAPSSAHTSPPFPTFPLPSRRCLHPPCSRPCWAGRGWLQWRSWGKCLGGRPRPPPSGALFFPHLCSSHPLNSCLSLPLDHHLIFLFPQPLAQGSGQCVLRKICQRSEDTCPPTCGKEAGVCPAQQPRCEAVSSVRPCCETIQSVVPWSRGGWRRGASRVPSPRCLVPKLCPALLRLLGL